MLDDAALKALAELTGIPVTPLERTRTHQDAPNAAGGINDNLNPENAAEGQINGNSGLLKYAEEQRAIVDRARAAYKAYQDNVKAAGGLLPEILKGITAGDDAYILLLKACKAIACMTNDPAYYDQARKSIIEVHGNGLLKEQPLRIELSETAARLEKLRAAAARDSSPNIKAAVKAHEKRITELEAKLKSTEPGH